MIDDVAAVPPVINRIATRAAEIGFDASCDPRTGSMLRTLAANRPGGRLLELGTGPGVSTAWLLDGMDSTATLTSVELETPLVEIAREFLGD
ncbi:MAG: SAM-dependent methyltransferase, partial [Actinobacteria bacterium]|nr:SAM-dependent methyltransferase [Actinomycetota bacterium]